MVVYHPPPNPTQSRSDTGLRCLLIGLVVLVLATLLCCGLVVGIGALGGWSLFEGMSNEQRMIEQVITQFMEAGQRNDPDAALALFADSAQTKVRRTDLEQLFADRNRFRAVSTISISEFSGQLSLDEIKVQISGKINYVDGSPPLSFSAQLIRQGNQWRLIQIDFP